MKRRWMRPLGLGGWRFSIALLITLGCLSYCFGTALSQTDTISSAPDHADDVAQLKTSEPTSKNKCSSTTNDRYLMIVSTLDGEMSALNVNKQGAMMWNVETGSIPLLSSSISRLEIVRNGIPLRLIPSLDGGLYQFDGDNVEALPFTADTLLSSSNKLTEDSVIVGGRESVTYGVNIKTGKIHYICQSSGCNQYHRDAAESGEDIVMIKRNTQTVRAVEMRTGIEKWNFSVGQQDVTFLEGFQLERRNGDGDEDVTVSCGDDNETSDDLNVQFKVSVPNGMVVAVDKNDPSEVIWQYQFRNPIAKVWTLKNSDLEELNLFDDQNIPALTVDNGQDQQQPPRPMLYLGFHQNQMYMQPSMLLTEEIADVMEKMTRSSGKDVIVMPKVKWKPYLATASSRTPVIHAGRPLLDYDGRKPTIGYGGQTITDDNSQGSVILKQDVQYPYDNGFYIFKQEEFEKLPVEQISDESRETNVAYTFSQVMNGFIWNWWKEVAFFTAIVCILLTLGLRTTVLSYLDPHDQITKEQHVDVPGRTRSLTGLNDLEVRNESHLPQKSQSSPMLLNPVEYVSRYDTDFEHLRCLGKGGFGVVFEARNKMDECSYAVKRICVKNSERAKEKVMREARALAKLDHGGIVRYYQVWLEMPPVGWQEEHDHKLIIKSECGGTGALDSSYTENSTAMDSEDMPEVQSIDRVNVNAGILKNSRVSTYNPLRPFENPKMLWDESTQAGSSSFGFVPHEADLTEHDESGSFSLPSNARTPPRTNHVFSSYQEDSVEVIFKNCDSDGDSDGDRPRSLPFSNYVDSSKGSASFENTNDSFNIIFEDSGCADKDSNDNDDTSSFCPNYERSVSEDSSLKDVIVQGSQLKENQPSQNVCSDSLLSTSPRAKKHGTKLSKQSDIPNSTGMTRSTMSSVSESAPKLYLYIQMQLCRRETLKDWLSSNTFQRNRNDLLDIFHQIVCAVEYVHDCGLMHRDLKPSNIFFSMDGTIKIGDFGLVTTKGEEGGLPSEGTPNTLDHHTDQVGTQLYMSPEQVASQTYSHKVDIYSLGLIFLELFHPFSTQMERVNVLTKAKDFRFPVRFQKELPEECNFVKWLLSPDPNARPSAQEILQNDMLQQFHCGTRMNTSRSRTISTSSSSS